VKDIEALQLAPIFRRTDRLGLTLKVCLLTKNPGFVKGYEIKKQIQDAVRSSIYNIINIKKSY
jgi:hypothetical protein